MAEDNPPKGMQLTPFDEAYKTHPYAVLKGLRENLPVYYDDEFGRYILTRHDDVQRVLRDLELWADGRKANEGTFPKKFRRGEGREGEPSMLRNL